jgi:hypothetical protein
MKGKMAYSGYTVFNRCLMHIFVKEFVILICVVGGLFLPIETIAQAEPEFDEVLIYLNIPHIGGTDINGVIKGQEVYLPVTEMFDFLKIRNVASPGLDSISGFFINRQAMYIVDWGNNRILYQDKTYNLNPDDFVRTETNLYLKSDYFGKVFGLDCSFNFNSLSVTLTTNQELPMIREMRQTEMRRNISRLKGQEKADTVIGRRYPVFHFGMADWSVITTQHVPGRKDVRLNLALGSAIAGGEANVFLNYNNNQPFREKEQIYYWRLVNNDWQAVRQIMLGKISSQAISSIYAPVLGVQVSNTPTTFRRSFGSYTLSDYTDPGWIVELYVNNVLVDYVKADASGFFTFEVPLVYGSSLVKLRFYGPWGEERSREQNISIPFNFLPPGTLEYTISTGIVEDTLNSRFSKIRFNLGLTRNITVGGGYEYLSSIASGPGLPFLTAGVRITQRLLFSGEYTYGVRSKGILTYRLPSNLQFELNYIKYEKGQKAINYNYLEERKAILTIPVRMRKFTVYSRLMADQIILPLSKYLTAEWLLSSTLSSVGVNFTTQGMFINPNRPYIYSNLSLSFRFPSGFVIIPQAQYDYTQSEFISAKCGLEKRLFQHGFFNISFENNFRSNIRNAEIGFRYDFSFAQTGVTARRSNNSNTFVEYARGSLMLDAKTRYLGANNRVNVGKGGIVFLPYLDINANGIHDAGEPKIPGLNLHVNGGRIEKDENDSTIRVFDLEPYTNYFVQFDPNSFDNIAWQLKMKTLSVVVDPNQFKRIEIPIALVGEASGTVYIRGNYGKIGQGRIIICFYNSNSVLVARTISEDDGYFSYLGLTPGTYTVRVDSSQLKRLNMIASPLNLPISIKPTMDGDIVDGIEFVLQKKADSVTLAKIHETIPETNQQIPIAEKDSTLETLKELIHVLAPETGEDTLDISIPMDQEKYFSIYQGEYAIQLYAFRGVYRAVAARENILVDAEHPLIVVIQRGLFKVRVTGFKNRKDARLLLVKLREEGFPDAFILKVKQ